MNTSSHKSKTAAAPRQAWPEGSTLRVLATTAVVVNGAVIPAGTPAPVWSRESVKSPWQRHDVQVMVLQWTVAEAANGDLLIPIGDVWENATVVRQGHGSFSSIEDVSPRLERALRFASIALRPSLQPGRIGGGADKNRPLLAWVKPPAWNRVIDMTRDALQGSSALAGEDTFPLCTNEDGSVEIPVDPSSNPLWAEQTEQHQAALLAHLDKIGALNIVLSLPSFTGRRPPFVTESTAVMDAMWSGIPDRMAVSLLESNIAARVW